MYERFRDLMYKSLDAELSVPERRELESALHKHPVLKQELDEMKRLRKDISELKDPGFSADFTESVVQSVKSESNLGSILDHSFKQVALAAAIVLLVLMGANMVKSGNYSLKGALAIEEQSLEQLMQSETLVYLE